MATTTVNSQLTFLELAKRTTDKQMMAIAEVMNETNQMLQDIPWFECNQLLSEKINRRTSLPTGSWRKVYEGVAPGASTTQIVIEPVALLEARSVVDEALAENAPSPKEYRRTEDVAFTEGLAQQVADAFVEATRQSSPEELDGLQARYNALSQTTVLGGGNAGGTSIYIVDWGRRKCYGIFPAAAANRGKLGLTIVDKGKEPVSDGAGGTYYSYVTQFKWYVGLAVRDELAAGRYCNINPTRGGANSFDEDVLIELLNLGHFNPASTRLYCNQEIMTQMQIKLKDKNNVRFTLTQGLSGVPVLSFLNAPVRRLDAIKTNESTVA